MYKMSEKLKNKYMEALKEKDIVLLDLKRVRHDYDLYVKQNDQVSNHISYLKFYIFIIHFTLINCVFTLLGKVLLKK